MVIFHFLPVHPLHMTSSNTVAWTINEKLKYEERYESMIWVIILSTIYNALEKWLGFSISMENCKDSNWIVYVVVSVDKKEVKCT
jgi:hypothetical protein